MTNYIVLTEERVKELIAEFEEDSSTVNKTLQEILDDPIQEVYNVHID